jgi:hypothetical protein
MTTAQFSYRQTGNGVYLVDAGDLHLGTVQKFSAAQWWAYPASSGGTVSMTLPSREQAAEALLQYMTDETNRLGGPAVQRAVSRGRKFKGASR